MCSIIITDYKPRYFLGEVFNPACDDCRGDSITDSDIELGDHVCNHSPQCVQRKPLHPPSPSITFLENQSSKYHEHIMSRSGVPGRYGGHERCFSIDNDNYGCEDWVWLKWHGSLHGYPDINPWDLRKYLDPSQLPALGLW